MKLIEKLFEQALDHAVPETWTTLTHGQLLMVKDKFAELIVAECVEQILTGVKTNPPQAEPPELVQTLVRRIERHFGVE